MMNQLLPKPAESESANAIDLLKRDHATVKALFQEALEDGMSGAQMKRIATTISHELKLHAQAEERLFYPAFKEKTKKGTDERDEVMEAYEEHAVVKDVLKKLDRLEARDESFRAKLQVLCDLVDHHVHEEEQQMFPEAQKLLGEKALDQIGSKIAAMKERANGSGTRQARRAPRTSRSRR